MNEQEIEGQLTRLARSDESVRAPESLHGFMYSLEASPAKHRSGLVSVRLPGLKLAHAAAGLAAAAVIAARNRQIAVHRQWMARSYAVTFVFVSSRVFNLVPAYWSHLGDVLSAVGVIAFTLASIVLVDLGLDWNELATRRNLTVAHGLSPEPGSLQIRADYGPIATQLSNDLHHI